MPVQQTITERRFTANSATKSFPLQFSVQVADDLKVWREEGDGSRILLTQDVDYSVYDLGLDRNATVVTFGTALPTGTFLIVSRELPFVQSVSLNNQGGVFLEVLEVALDRLTMMLQQVSSVAARSLRVAPGLTTVGELPGDPAERANKLIQFTNDGLGVQASLDASQLDAAEFTGLTNTEVKAIMVTAITDALAGVQSPRQTEGTFLPALKANVIGNLNQPNAVTYATRWARWTRTGNHIQGVGYMSITAVDLTGASGDIRLDLSGMGIMTGMAGAQGQLILKSAQLVLPTLSNGEPITSINVTVPPNGDWGVISIYGKTSTTFGLQVSAIQNVSVEAPLNLYWTWSAHL